MEIQHGAALIEHRYLKKFRSQQKHAIKITFHENKFAHTTKTLSKNRKGAQCLSL